MERRLQYEGKVCSTFARIGHVLQGRHFIFHAAATAEFNGAKHLLLKEDDIVGILETDDTNDLKPTNNRVLIKSYETVQIQKVMKQSSVPKQSQPTGDISSKSLATEILESHSAILMIVDVIATTSMCTPMNASLCAKIICYPLCRLEINCSVAVVSSVSSLSAIYSVAMKTDANLGEANKEGLNCKEFCNLRPTKVV